MSGIQMAVAELVELVGEEQAEHLVADLVDSIKAGRRPFDEVVQFLRTDAAARGDQAAADQAAFAAKWDEAGRRRSGEPDVGGRPSRVAFYVTQYRQAADKGSVLSLAESQLSKTSFWRLRRELGLE